MQSEDLRAFVATCRHGTISAAAGHLGVSQPSLSRAIMRLEKELDTRLVERSRPAITPTRAGLRLLAYAESALQGLEILERELREEGTIGGRLEIAVAYGPWHRFVNELVSRFEQRYRDIAVSLHAMDAAAVTSCIAHRHCDVGFTTVHASDPLIHAELIKNDEIVLVTDPKHRFAQASEIALVDLAAETFVGAAQGHGAMEAMAKALRTDDGESWDEDRETVSALRTLDAVQAGRGVALVPLRTLQAYGMDGFAWVRLKDVPLQRPLYLLHLPLRIPATAAAFLTTVRREAARL